MMFEFAKKTTTLKEGEAPSKLVDWLLAGWKLWATENRQGPAAIADVPEELRLVNLGVAFVKTTMKQIPVRRPVRCRNLVVTGD
jgi:hypothetical protein